MSTIFFGIADRTFVFDRTVGRAEFSGSGFRAPMDLAIASDGRIYVANRSWEYRPDGVRITMLTIDEDYIGQFSSYGEGDGQMIWPSSVAVDSNQNVYVTDDHLNRVSVFDKDGQFLSKWGEAGSGDGQLNQPYCIRFDKDDNAYISDSGNNRIQKFSKDGRFISKFGQQGSRAGELNLPWGITIDNDGNILVADWRNDRIQKFSPDGQYLSDFGNSGTSVGQFRRPTGVAVDKDGDIYVADWMNDRVQVFTGDARYVTTFLGEASLSKWGAEKLNSNPDMIRQRNMVQNKEAERRLWRPKAVAVDSEGRVIIVDSNRQRLQVYRKEVR